MCQSSAAATRLGRKRLTHCKKHGVTCWAIETEVNMKILCMKIGMSKFHSVIFKLTKFSLFVSVFLLVLSEVCNVAT